MSRYLIRVFAVLSTLLVLAAVGSDARAADPINVVATLSDLGKIAEAVGGDKVRVTTIASGVQDPHFVDPKPSYVLKLRDADLFLVNGLELEIGWVPPLLEGARNGRVKPGSPGYVDCSKNIPVLEVPSGQVTRAEGDVHPYGNPHYTTDPLNDKIVADTIAQAFSQLRPADAEYFAGRKKAFQAAIDKALFGAELVDLVGGKKLDRLARSGELDAFLQSESSGGAKLATKLGGWLGQMAPLKGARVVFFHKSYSYFNQRFGLNVAEYVELKPGIQPGPSHLADVVSTIRRENIRVVATHPFYDAKIAKLVAEKGGAQLVPLPLNVGGVKGADDILSFFNVATSTLLKGAGK
jgi:ABC-type Zn uptake system ZnuABC Zn-binding protein ZnuA